MEREIVLSSYSVKNQGSNKPEDSTTQFTMPITLDSNTKYVVGLNRIINMSFTWFNLIDGYDNRLIQYSKDGGVSFTDIVFQPGVWSYTEFNRHIQNARKIKNSGADDEYPINLAFDDTTFNNIKTKLSTGFNSKQFF